MYTYCVLPQKNSNKGIEASTSGNKHNGLSEIEMSKTANESDEEHNNNNNRLNMIADDAVVEEKSEDEIEEKYRKVKMTKEKGIKMRDK